MRNLPTTNSTAVTAPPTQTSRQATRASGSTLNSAANSAVMTTSETTWLSTWSSVAEMPSGSIEPSAPPNAVSAALSTSETSSRKATLRIMPKENTRFRMNDLRPPFSGSGATSHARLSAAWSWPNAPVAPSARAMMLSTVGRTPLDPGARACSRMLRICSVAEAPMSEPSWTSRCPRMSWGSSTAPSSSRISTISGGSEKMV